MPISKQKKGATEHGTQPRRNSGKSRGRPGATPAASSIGRIDDSGVSGTSADGARCIIHGPRAHAPRFARFRDAARAPRSLEIVASGSARRSRVITDGIGIFAGDALRGFESFLFEFNVGEVRGYCFWVI